MAEVAEVAEVAEEVAEVVHRKCEKFAMINAKGREGENNGRETYI